MKKRTINNKNFERGALFTSRGKFPYRYNLGDCPYCGANIDLKNYRHDGYGLEEGEIFNSICPKCGKSFSYSTTITLHYTLRKSSCLNNGKHHKYELNEDVGQPSLSTMVCRVCGKERELTLREHKKYGIPTMKEYCATINQLLNKGIKFSTKI